ncbi:hypothetical protein PMAYCL1PPCAC_12212, partial [Pristionchus mayeri]
PLPSSHHHLTRMDLGGEAVHLIKAIDEFYSTTDESKRLALNEYLCNFKTGWDSPMTIQGCFLLLSRHNSPNVQYFGALSLYDTIKHRWVDILDRPELLETLKGFLIKALAEGATVQSQSLTNKLSSSLALLALYCIPDVWNSPVQDLTALWAATPELLLRVLAELAAEFPNVHMPLTQRSILKTELHRVSEDMIKILSTVLQSAADSAPSLLNAAVECVEQWLRLPGSNLKQWTPLLSHVFGAVQDDSTALTNLLTILGANDELVNEEQLVHHVLHYVCATLAQKVMGELSRDALSEEIGALSAATCSLAETVVPVLVRSSMRGSTQLLEQLTSFFAKLSSFPGRYPMDEGVSEMPHIFFSSLREEVCMGAKAEDREKLLAALRSPFEEVLVGAVNKLMYAPMRVREEMNEEEKEAFENYRVNRSECGVNSFLILGQSALVYLNRRCCGAAEETGGDRETTINLMESCLYNWEQIADYLGEEDQTEIANLVEVTSKMFTSGASSVEEARIANTLMRLIFAISHLVSGHEQATALELQCIQMVLHQLEVKEVTGEALHTLIKLIEDRPPWLRERGYSDDLISRCSSLFQNESLPQKHRLAALKAIGISLSLREPAEIMDILRAPLEVYLAGVEGETTNASEEARKKFQIGIFSCLFSSLHSKTREDGESVVLLLRLATPLLLGILERNPTPIIAERACESLRSACVNVPSSRISEFFVPLKKAVALSLNIHTFAASNLAKTLVFSASSVLAREMAETVEEWVTSFERAYPSEGGEEWIGLILQILKKEWKLMDSSPERALNIISSAVNLSTQALSSSEDPNVVKCSSQLLATIVSNVASRGHELGRRILKRKIVLIVQIVFRRIQIELMRQTIESLAEVLFFFVQVFTTETRNVLNQERNGTTPMVSALFREIGNLRNFKQMTLRLNHAARKDST